MDWNPTKWPPAVTFGFAAVLAEVVFTVIGYASWPVGGSGKFCIFHNWQSDLGNTSPGYNTLEGAHWYTAGQVILGVCIILFVLGMDVVRHRRGNRALLRMGQFFGLGAGVAVIMSGIYTEEFSPHHTICASTIFFALMPAILMLSLYVRRHPKMWDAITYYGIMVVVLDLSFLALSTPLLEWVAIGTATLWILMVSLNLFFWKVVK